MTEQTQAMNELITLLEFEEQKLSARPKKLRRFVNGKVYRLFSDLTPAQQANIRAREQREKEQGLWWEEADKESSLIELRYLRSKQPGDYDWTPQKGWVLRTPKPPALQRSQRITPQEAEAIRKRLTSSGDKRVNFEDEE